MELILIYSAHVTYQKRTFCNRHGVYPGVAPATLKPVTKIAVWDESPVRTILSAWT